MTSTVRLGIFIVITLTLLAIGSFLIGQRQFLFSSTYPLQAQFTTVSGLTEGAEVRLGGVEKGVVKHILVPRSPGELVTVQFDLDKSARQIVRTDSVATIGSEGLLGAKFLEVSFGTESGQPAPPWATLKTSPGVDLSDLVRKADTVLQTTAAAMADVQASAENLHDISDKINGGRGTIGALVNDRSIYNQMSAATANASAGAAAFSDDMEALKHNFLLKGYFDKRGYEDQAILTENLIKTLPAADPLKSFHFETHSLFTDSEHAKLKNEKSLDEAGRYLEHYPFGAAVIVAGGGATGDSATVHTLLEARAAVVREYLVEHFKMDDSRLKTMDAGKNQNAGSDTGTIDVMIYPTGVSIKK